MLRGGGTDRYQRATDPDDRLLRRARSTGVIHVRAARRQARPGSPTGGPWVQYRERQRAAQGRTLTLAVLKMLTIGMSTVGCSGSLRSDPQFSTQSDRLMAYYPDLQTGRFAVVADFEQPRHMELFQLAGESATAELGLLIEGGVTATGGRCLHAVFGDAGDTLLADSSTARNWFLKRDWRDYNLLLMSVHSPSDGVELELSIVAGSTKPVHTLLPLHAGWNLVRLDLHEVGESVPLDSVRALRWSVVDPDRPIELRFDDIILADNREAVMGSSTGYEGRIYLERDGRRWRIGAAGRFELGFSNGQIVEWYDLESDPNRLRNLLADNVLGPLPIVLPDSDRDADVADFSDLGESVLARQRVLEVSELRVMVACDWEFTAARGGPSDETPFHRWTYTIYPTGQVFVHIETTTSHGAWQVDNLGLALTRAGGSKLELVAHSAAQLDASADLRHACYGYVQPAMLNGPSLLWVMHDGRVAPRMEAIQESDQHRAILVASGGATDRPVQSWDCLISVWPADQVSGAGAEERALDYCYPAQFRPSVGRLVTDHPDDPGHDGYAEQTGSYLVATENGRLKLLLDGDRRKRHAPVFTILGSSEQEAVIYVDDIIVETQARDAAGNIIFQIPRTISVDARVEVNYLEERID